MEALRTRKKLKLDWITEIGLKRTHNLAKRTRKKEAQMSIPALT